MNRRIIPLIMCGGAGTRLWPASREVHPKQFLSLFGARSTFQDTLLRAWRTLDRLVALRLVELHLHVGRAGVGEGNVSELLGRSRLRAVPAPGQEQAAAERDKRGGEQKRHKPHPR